MSDYQVFWIVVGACVVVYNIRKTITAFANCDTVEENDEEETKES